MIEDQDMLFDVFISYSNVDKNVADSVCAALEDKGISCWMAPRNIIPGMPFAEAIIDGINSSRLFVLIYSTNSNDSSQVVREVDRAVHNGLSIINFRLEDVPLSKQLQYYLSSVHWLDAISPPMEKHLDQLCNVVQLFLKQEMIRDTETTETSGQGFIKTDEATGKGRAPGKSRRKQIVYSGIFLAVAAAIILLVVLKPGGTKKEAVTSIDSIVILPFGNYTGTDTLDSYLSGMHSLLINELGKIKDLRVISKVSSDTYKNTVKTIPQITKELDVDAAVETGILDFGDSIYIQQRLMSGGPEEKQLWIGDYGESKGNLFNLYNKIIKRIANEMQISLTATERARLTESRTVDPEALDAYLKGVYYLGDASPASLKKARDYLNSSIEKDPGWAPLYAAMGTVWYFMGANAVEPIDIAYPEAYKYTDKAIKLDPNLEEAHRITAVLAWAAEWDWEKAEKEILEALAINPSHSISRMYYSFFLFTVQRPDEAKMQADLAFRLDPRNPFIKAVYGNTKLYSGDCESAMSVLEDVLATDPDYFLANGYIQWAAFLCGDLDRVFEADKQMMLIGVEAMNKIDKIYEDKGFYTAYDEMMKQLEIISDTVLMSPSEMAFRYYMINRDDKALEWIERGAAIHEPAVIMLCTLLRSTRLSENPRFIAVLKKMNLPLPSSG